MRVDGDILLFREELLRGAYETTAPYRAPAGSGDLISKGYQYLDIIERTHLGNIKLSFATGKQAPSKVLRRGFIAAADAWSAIPGSAVRIRTSNTGPAITVRMIAASRWRADSPCPSLEACGAMPVDGKPGRVIYIRSAPFAGDCTAWEGSNLINVTRHELGHTLGFAHPEEKGSKPVKGTGECPYVSEDDCDEEDELGYSTIMGSAFVNRGCVVTPARLTRDDYLTCAKVYPSR